MDGDHQQTIGWRILIDGVACGGVSKWHGNVLRSCDEFETTTVFRINTGAVTTPSNTPVHKPTCSSLSTPLKQKSTMVIPKTSELQTPPSHAKT